MDRRAYSVSADANRAIALSVTAQARVDVWRRLIAGGVPKDDRGARDKLHLAASEWREAAGESGYDLGFVATWADKLLFYNADEWLFTLLYTVFAGLVTLTYLAYPPVRKRSRTADGGDSAR